MDDVGKSYVKVIRDPVVSSARLSDVYSLLAPFTPALALFIMFYFCA